MRNRSEWIGHGIVVLIQSVIPAVTDLAGQHVSSAAGARWTRLTGYQIAQGMGWIGSNVVVMV
jgi:hypothetical protein